MEKTKNLYHAKIFLQRENNSGCSPRCSWCHRSHVPKPIYQSLSICFPFVTVQCWFSTNTFKPFHPKAFVKGLRFNFPRRLVHRNSFHKLTPPFSPLPIRKRPVIHALPIFLIPFTAAVCHLDHPFVAVCVKLKSHLGRRTQMTRCWEGKLLCSAETFQLNTLS